MLTPSNTDHIIYWLILLKFLWLLCLKTMAIFIQNWSRSIFSWLIWYTTRSFRHFIRSPLLSHISKLNDIFPTTNKRSTRCIGNIPSTLRWISGLITTFLPLIIVIHLWHINFINTTSLRHILPLIGNNRLINLFNLINSCKCFVGTFTNSTDWKELHKHKKTHGYKWTCQYSMDLIKLCFKCIYACLIWGAL